MRLRWLAAALLLALPLPAPASLTSRDVAEIRLAIRQSLEALAPGDACGAVQRPLRVAFRDLLVMSREVVQQVAITDGAGSAWLAYIALERGEDGGWHARACHLVQPGRAISA